MDETQELRELLARLQDGDRSVAGELYRRYQPFVRAAVRRHLDSRLRPQFDSLDFTQDVWASFLVLPPERLTFDSPQALVGFLGQMARHKLATAFRRHVESQKAGNAREIPVEALEGDDAGLPTWPASPIECAIAAERWERLLSRARPGEWAVLEWLREGYTYDEIARMVGISTSTLKRIMKRLKEVAER